MAKSNRTNRVRRTQPNAAEPSSTPAEDTAVPREDTAPQDAEPQADTEEPTGAAAENSAEAGAPAGKGRAETADATGDEEAAAAAKEPDAKAAKAEKGSDPAKRSDAAKSSDAAKGSRDRRGAKSGNPAKRSASRASGRKTSAYTSPSGTQTVRPNSRWFLPTMITVLLLGLAWLVVFYVSNGSYPVEAWGYWNLGVGFAILVAGLMMSTRWR